MLPPPSPPPLSFSLLPQTNQTCLINRNWKQIKSNNNN